MNAVQDAIRALAGDEQAREFDRVRAECEADRELYEADPDFARILGITPLRTKSRLRAAEQKRNPRGLHGTFHFEQFRDGIKIDEWESKNIIPNAALNDNLDVWLSGGTQDTTLFVALKGTGSVAAGDTMASHAGWAEITDYDEANRLAWTDGGVSSQSVSNSGSPAVFTINATVTVAGAFLTGVNTKGGTTGILYAVVNFSASKSLADNDTLTVTYTVTAADDGV